MFDVIKGYSNKIRCQLNFNYLKNCSATSGNLSPVYLTDYEEGMCERLPEVALQFLRYVH